MHVWVFGNAYLPQMTQNYYMWIYQSCSYQNETSAWKSTYYLPKNNDLRSTFLLMFKISWEYAQPSSFLFSEICAVIGEVGNWKDNLCVCAWEKTLVYSYHKSWERNFVYLWLGKERGPILVLKKKKRKNSYFNDETIQINYSTVVTETTSNFPSLLQGFRIYAKCPMHINF